jgi:excisionase family DNA binding protein
MNKILETLASEHGLLTVQRTAGLLGHHRDTIYKAIKDGKLPVVRTLGNAVRLDPNAIADWLRRRGAI